MSHAQASRRALVTGGSGDLGGAICQALAKGGYQVIVHANASLARADDVAAAIRDAGGSAQSVAFDVTDAGATRQAIDLLLADGAIHAVVNNAGVHQDGPLAGMSEEAWHRVIDVSLHGFFHV
ncbi:MAG: SDR family NAD(P)-dependent oxidoreductase, partial [Dyella sp.]|nr:SDR family NAD(P)-dependent oxidoreductase [Dyella sp.]